MNYHGSTRTHCKHGHLFTSKNTKWRWDKRYTCYYRQCRMCSANAKRSRYVTDDAYRLAQLERLRLGRQSKQHQFHAVMALVVPDKEQYRCN